MRYPLGQYSGAGEISSSRLNKGKRAKIIGSSPPVNQLSKQLTPITLKQVLFYCFALPWSDDGSYI
jgi:hypothetical protein